MLWLWVCCLFLWLKIRYIFFFQSSCQCVLSSTGVKSKSMRRPVSSLKWPLLGKALLALVLTPFQKICKRGSHPSTALSSGMFSSFHLPVSLKPPSLLVLLFSGGECFEEVFPFICHLSPIIFHSVMIASRIMFRKYLFSFFYLFCFFKCFFSDQILHLEFLNIIICFMICRYFVCILLVCLVLTEVRSWISWGWS